MRQMEYYRTVQPITRRELMRLALPGMLFAVMTHAYRTVDQFWIQGVSTEAQAAIGSSVFVLITFFAAFELVSGGAGPLIARATGANDPDARRRVLGTALWAAVGIGLLVSAVGGAGAPWLSAALGLSGQTAAECTTYLRVISLTILPLALTPLVDQSFIAQGDTRSPMILQGLSLGLNFALTPLLIFEAGGYGLGLGIAGAALASNGSRAVATAIGLAWLTERTGLRWADVRPSAELRRVLKVGSPIAMGVLTYALVYWALLYFVVSPLGPHVNAALGIGFSALEAVTWPAFHGVSLAVASVVGRSLGAGRPEEARRVVKLALPLITGMGIVASLAFWLGGAFLTGLFTDDPSVHAAATTYAVILAASQLAVAWEALFEGALAGAGDTETVFWLSTPANVLRVPLAWALALSFGWGAAGIWWAINVTTWAKAAGKGYMTWRGRWAELEI